MQILPSQFLQNVWQLLKGIFGCEVKNFKAIWLRNYGLEDPLSHLLNCPLLNHELLIYLCLSVNLTFTFLNPENFLWKEVQLKHTCTCIFMQCQVWCELTNQEALTVLSSIVKHAGSGESMKEVHGETWDVVKCFSLLL